jgi:hypothetical protein
MLIKDTKLTAQLIRWLRQSHDDGQPELAVRYVGTGVHTDVEVLQQDGSEPSETETLEIQARMAAHAVTNRRDR